MFLFKTVRALQSHLRQKREKSKSIGFIPTLGALHNGHGSLISHSIKENHYTVVSIFVNPTQFNDPKDLQKYPRPLTADLQFLSALGCDVLFLPSDQEIYPDEDILTPDIDLGHLNSTLEAAFRPGHFEGVIQVVHRLLTIVQPDFIFMGKKDLQQMAIIRQLIRESNFSTHLVGLPIVREPNGLAQSSRNELLSPENRHKASIIYNTLRSTADQYQEKSLVQLKEEALDQMNHPPFRVEYFEFVRTDNLKIISDKTEYNGSVSVVTAVWCKGIRLIDNMEMTNGGLED